MGNDVGNAFDDVFNSATHIPDTNKAVDTPKVQDESANQQKQLHESDKNTSESDLQARVESKPFEQPVRKRGRKK